MRRTVLLGPLLATQGSGSPKKRERYPFVSLGWLLLLLLIVVFSGLLGESLNGGENFYGWFNSLGLLLVLAGISLVTLLLLLKSKNLLWSPIIWFLLNSSLFYVLGPLIYTFGNEESIARLEQTWVVTPRELWFVNMLNLSGLLVMLTTFFVLGLLIPVPGPTQEEEGKETEVVKYALFFSVLGFAFKYFLLVPYIFGFLPFILPGVFMTFSRLIYLGLLFITYLSNKRGGIWTVLMVLFFVLEAVTSLLTFSKEELLYIPIFLVLGRYLATKRISNLVVGAMACIFLYMVTVPFVTESRKELSRRGFYTEGSFQVRLDVAKAVLEGKTEGSQQPKDGEQGWWVRLCYVPFEVFAVAQRDDGFYLRTFEDIPYAPIPRILWPGKPSLTQIGVTFTEMLVEYETFSSTALGIFAEAYWNGGFLYVVLMSLYLGGLFFFLSQVSLSIIVRSLWGYFPLIFLGIKFGLMSDRWFVPSYVSAVAMYLVLYLVIFLILKVIQGFTSFFGGAGVQEAERMSGGGRKRNAVW